MTKDYDFRLVGHLQVMDEPLSSLYTDRVSGRYFIFVRTYDTSGKDVYVLSEVKPSVVLQYMDGQVGLRQIFRSANIYSYTNSGTAIRKESLLPISQDTASSMLAEDGLEDMFDNHLSYKSVTLKRHLQGLIRERS